MGEKKVLGVAAWVDRVDESTWCAWVMAEGGAPFGGLFAFGLSFAGAREALAEVIREAVAGGTEGVAIGDFEALRILAMTRKTFPLGQVAS